VSELARRSGAGRWVLLVSALMFVTSIWFVLAGVRNGAQAAAPATKPLATVREIMFGMIGPASTTVYESVSIIVSAEGVVENYPRTDREWDVVAASAAAIAEAGGLLLVDTRKPDDDRWPKLTQAMIDASLVSKKAADGRDKDALLESGEALNASCDNCHRIYIGE
jgi:hypothetical protein